MIHQKILWIACSKVSIALEALEVYRLAYLTLEGPCYIIRWTVDVQGYYI